MQQSLETKERSCRICCGIILDIVFESGIYFEKYVVLGFWDKNWSKIGQDEIFQVLSIHGVFFIFCMNL